MQEKNALQRGWEFSAHLVGADAAANVGSEYASEVAAAIEKLTKDITGLKSNQTDAVLGGFLAEYWHADTFNVDAVAARSAHRYDALSSTEYGSVDIRGNFFGAKDYSSKFMVTGERTAIAQAAYSKELGQPKYHNQERLIPKDQMAKAAETANRHAARNDSIRPEVAEAYREARAHFTDRIADSDGIESIPLSKRDDLLMAKNVKSDEFDPADFGESMNSAIKPEYVLRQALKAGYTAAAITVVMQLAPEIFKTIDYLIKTDQIDMQQVKKVGKKAISAGAEGFLRGSISCSLLIMCEKGLLGEFFKGINPVLLGATVAIVLETIKNSILVAAGKMTVRQMGAAFTEGIAISAGYILGCKIGGVIGQAIGFELPVVGYLVGSLVGCAFAAVYNIGKKRLISFCIDTGFTCFGLVEQSYELPEEVLTEMGINIVPVPRTNVSRAEIPRIDVAVDVERINFETIKLTVIRRGVISINKIGYVK
jgi:hypothetical protein